MCNIQHSVYRSNQSFFVTNRDEEVYKEVRYFACQVQPNEPDFIISFLFTASTFFESWHLFSDHEDLARHR